MLEIKRGGKEPTNKENGITNENSEEEKLNINHKNKRDFQVVINTEDFKRNLKIKRLKNKQNEIKYQKKKIKLDIEKIKENAWWKIYFGIMIMLYGIGPLIIALKENAIEDININRQVSFIIGGLILHLYFNSGKKRKKGGKKK